MSLCVESGPPHDAPRTNTVHASPIPSRAVSFPVRKIRNAPPFPRSRHMFPAHIFQPPMPATPATPAAPAAPCQAWHCFRRPPGLESGRAAAEGARSRGRCATHASIGRPLRALSLSCARAAHAPPGRRPAGRRARDFVFHGARHASASTESIPPAPPSRQSVHGWRESGEVTGGRRFVVAVPARQDREMALFFYSRVRCPAPKAGQDRRRRHLLDGQVFSHCICRLRGGGNEDMCA